MRRNLRLGVVAGLALLMLGCMTAFIATLPPIWPMQVRQAHQRWQQANLRHYEVEVSWADGWQFGHARVEMHNGRFVGGTDLDTGQPLAASKLVSASYFASIDTLFALIEKRAWASIDWRILVGRWHPMLDRWLEPCLPPLQSATFDAQFGYPREISYNNGWCNRTTFFAYSHVQLLDLKPLP